MSAILSLGFIPAARLNFSGMMTWYLLETVTDSIDPLTVKQLAYRNKRVAHDPVRNISRQDHAYIELLVSKISFFMVGFSVRSNLCINAQYKQSPNHTA